MAKAVQTTQPQVPDIDDDYRRMLEETKGQGISKAQEDNLVPLITIFQSNSKPVNRQGGAYIEGAEPGFFWLRGATPPIINGAEGFVFEPCYFYKDFAEWIPRDQGGGLVGMHRTLPPDAQELRDEHNPNKVRWKLPNGHEVLERRNHLGFIVREDGTVAPYALPMTSTLHSVSRSWMTTMSNRVVDGINPPSFAFLYRVRTRQRSNAKGTWFTVDITPVTQSALLNAKGMVNKELFMQGKALYESCLRGDKLAAEMDDDAEPAADGAM
jgi:hypothetical protein